MPLAAMALVCATLSACVVAPYYPPQEQVVMTAPPPPQAEYVGPPPAAGYVWITGFWAWEMGRHVWVGGHWSAPRPGYRWGASHLATRGAWLASARWLLGSPLSLSDPHVALPHRPWSG